MIHVLAFITAHPGRREEVLAAFRANMAAVHAEDGCIEYLPVIDSTGMGTFPKPVGPDTFVVIEKWRDAAALKAHAASPHMAAYGARTREMVAARAIHVLESAA
jgi:quinol monooxygenase YgiN